MSWLFSSLKYAAHAGLINVLMDQLFCDNRHFAAAASAAATARTQALRCAACTGFELHGRWVQRAGE
jgi:hypothetical protein